MSWIPNEHTITLLHLEAFLGAMGLISVWVPHSTAQFRAC